jgi:hypothetical protein
MLPVLHISGAAPDDAGRPHGTRRHSSMPDTDDIPRRRRVLVLDVTQAASEVSRLVHEARDLHLPVEPGVREGRDALVRWAVLIEELLP